MKVPAYEIHPIDRDWILEAFKQFAEVNIVGCWEWKGRKRSGYGSIILKGRSYWAHRVSYALFVGPIAEDMVIDHCCRHRGCCNPAHLLQVTHQENCRAIHRRYTNDMQHSLLDIQIEREVFVI